MSNPMPGWYPDPEAPERQRFWDGMQWTEARAYPEGVPPPGTEDEGGTAERLADTTESRNSWRWIALIALIVLALLLIAAFVYPGFLRSSSSQPEQQPLPPRPSPTSPATPPGPSEPSTPLPTPTVTPSLPSPPVPPSP